MNTLPCPSAECSPSMCPIAMIAEGDQAAAAALGNEALAAKGAAHIGMMVRTQREELLNELDKRKPEDERLTESDAVARIASALHRHFANQPTN